MKKLKESAAPAKRKTVGLALGSGGVKGLAHVGVLKVLLEHNIPIDYIAGTSIGAWVGSHYALYKDLEKLTELTVGKRKEKLRGFLEPTLQGGLIKGDKMEKLLLEWLGDKNFSDTKIPFTAVATDLVSGKTELLNNGKIVPAVRASMSIPTMFKPVEYQGKILVDGGASNPVPADVVKQMGADIVIAVNLDNYQKNSWFKKDDAQKVTAVMGRSIDIMRHYLTQHSQAYADIVLEPPLNISEVQIWKDYFFKKNSGNDIVQAGSTEAINNLDKIKDLLE